MATITGLDAFRMLAIEAASVVGAVVRDGKMYLLRKDGAELPNPVTISAVQGPPGSITSSPAGGDLTGNYPNPTVGAKKITAAQVADLTLTDAQVAAANKDGVATKASLRTLGTGALQAAAGNHTHDIPKVRSGVLSHAADTPNAKTTIAYANVFPQGYFTEIPRVVLTPDTNFPDAVTYWAVASRTLTGFSIVATRTTTTATNFVYFAHGA